MNTTLQRFYENQIERDAVREFMVSVLGEIAVERAFDGKPTSGIQEARECIEKSFDKLEEAYGKAKEVKITNSR